MFGFPHKILVVDDEQELTGLLATALKSWGRITILQANSVEFALEAMAQEKIDLVISDINMNTKTGYDLLKAIREQGNDVPFILISGQVNIYDDKKCSPALFKSIYAFYEKPFRFDELKKTVKEALEQRELKKNEGAKVA